MATDLDLIAVPWVDDAESAESLVESLRAAVNGSFREIDPNLALKPHGRRAWSIYLNDEGCGPYLDLSVTPNDKWHEEAP